MQAVTMATNEMSSEDHHLHSHLIPRVGPQICDLEGHRDIAPSLDLDRVKGQPTVMEGGVGEAISKGVERVTMEIAVSLVLHVVISHLWHL